MAWKWCRSVSLGLLASVLLGGCESLGGVARKADSLIANVMPDPAPKIELSWLEAAKSCEVAPSPELTLADPACVSLLMRGRQMECVATRIAHEASTKGYSAPDGLLKWEICVRKIARVLADGYYLGNREIERQLQLCDALLEASPTQPVKRVFPKLYRAADSPAPVRPSPAEYGVAGRPSPVGLQKCAVLLPPKALPVETTPVVGEPVVELPPPPQEATGRNQPTAVTPKRRPKKASGQSQKEAVPAKKKSSASNGGSGKEEIRKDGPTDVRSRGKQT